MNFARLEKSRRLQRVLSVLQSGGEHTTRELIQKAAVCAVNSIIAELRSNGFAIECERRGDMWFYWLAKRYGKDT